VIRKQAMFAGLTTGSSPFACLSPFLGNLFRYLAVTMTHRVHSCAARSIQMPAEISVCLSQQGKKESEGTAAQLCKLKR